MNQKFPQGTFEYFKKKRNIEIIKTVLQFAVSAILFIAGYAATMKRANLLTVAAVLGMLPASRSAVNMFMYLHYHGCSEELRNRLIEKLGLFENIKHLYGLVFTTYKVTYEIPSIVVKNGNVCGYSEKKRESFKELESHISDLLVKNGYKYTVKIFDNFDTYVTRCEQLMEQTVENEDMDMGAGGVLCNISL